MRRKIDVAREDGISLERLAEYERAGILRPIAAGDFEAYQDELRIAVITEAERLGFTLDEIVAFIRLGETKPDLH